MHGAARSPARHGADDRDLLPAAEDDARGECIVEHRPAGDWLKELDAGTFILQCLGELK